MSKPHHFFSFLSRMKYINRWSLMYNTRAENIQEHSLQVATVAHALALIQNTNFGGNLNPERIATLAIFHDTTEVLTGDMPTPIKYFNPKIKEEYKKVEKIAASKILDLLPPELKQAYVPIFEPEETEHQNWEIVKYADRICAYIKCLEELRSGNHEFAHAKKAIESELRNIENKAVQYFLDIFIPSFGMTLDEVGVVK